MTVEEALQFAGDTKALLTGIDVLGETPMLFQRQFPRQRAIIIADVNTWQAAGKVVYEALIADKVLQDKPFIFTDADLYAEYSNVEELTTALAATDAVPIAIGSGTINDLTKLSSHLTGRQYLCVATAASVDGYTSYGASITSDGAKKTFNCPAPQAVLCDFGVLCKAHVEMTAAGYADLFAKITAGADWLLADMLEVEEINHEAWALVQDGLQNALSDPDGVSKGSPKAIGKLIEGLIMSGFAMQSMHSSRPASGAEHYLSHLWDMENHRFNGKHVSHGFQVGVGTAAVTNLYEKILQYPIKTLNIKDICSRWFPSIDAMDKVTIELFGNSGFLERCLSETHEKYITPKQLEEQLRLLVARWDEIRETVNNQLVPLHDLCNSFRLAGAPCESSQIGITAQRLQESFLRAPFIRSRYTILDLVQRIGFLKLMVNV